MYRVTHTRRIIGENTGTNPKSPGREYSTDVHVNSDKWLLLLRHIPTLPSALYLKTTLPGLP